MKKLLQIIAYGFLIYVWLFWLGHLLHAQSQTTVTGVVFDSGGSPATSGFVEFDLQPAGASFQFFVTGVGVIAPQSVQCGIDGSGNVKNFSLTGACLVWGNSLVLPANTTYTVQIAPNGIVTNVVPGECINGASYSLSNPVFCPRLSLNPQSAVVITTPIQQNLIPGADAVFNLGSSLNRYANVFAANGTFTNMTLLNSLTVPGNLSVTGNLTATTGQNTISAYNINGYVTVDGIHYPRTDVGINAAIADCTVGSGVFLPAATYTISGSITISKLCSLVGAGWGANLQLQAGVGGTTDVVVVQPVGGGVISGLKLENFQISPAAGTPGRHAIRLDGTNGEIVNMVIDHVKVQTRLGGNAINAIGSGNAQGTPVLTTIKNSILYGGIDMNNAGDTIDIIHNDILDTNGLNISFQAGASNCTVKRNNMTGDGGYHFGANTVALYFQNNEIETNASFTGSNGAVLDLDGGITDAVISDNSFQIVNGVTNINDIRVNNAGRTHIHGNRLSRGGGTSKDIVTTALAADTEIGTNFHVSSFPVSSMVSDAGTRTVAMEMFNGALTNLLNNKFIQGINSVGNQANMMKVNASNNLELGGAGTNAVQLGALQWALVPEINAPAGAAGFDVIWGDSPSHRLKFNNNNGGADVVVGTATTDVLSNKSTAAGALTGVVATGTSTLTANATLGAVTSQAAITTVATGTLTSDAIEWSYASAPGAGDSLCIVSAYVTAGNVNFVRSNPTAAAQNVSAIVINWRVIR